jgi:hypothetical protein
MDELWSPPLQVREHAGRCRLSLVGVTSGDGETLQDAADDLVGKVLGFLVAVRRSGLRLPAEVGPPDLRLLAFLYELDELVGRGEDIRTRLFAGCDDTGLAA